MASVSGPRAAVIFHGDFDGVVSAAILCRAHALEDPSIACTEPFTVDRAAKRMDAEGIGGGSVLMADIAPNNKNPRMTVKFIEFLAARFGSVAIFDHHAGWEDIAIPPNVSVSVDRSSPSCARHILGKFENCFMPGDAIAGLTRDADIVDTGGYRGLTAEGALLYRALKADMKDAVVKTAAVRYLAGGQKDGELRSLLKAKASEYAPIAERTARMMAGVREVAPGICYLDVGAEQCDLTIAISECYGRFHTVVIEYQAGVNRFYIIATSRRDIDLLERMGLRSGIRQRVTITKAPLDEVIARIT